MFSGALVALLTPFKDGKVDEASLRALVEYQLAGGANGIVPCGTTGEAATLAYDEYDVVIRIVVETVNGRVPVIAGSGSNDTERTITLSKKAKRAGADAALLVAPYYNRPTQAGLIAHFEKVAGSVDLPIVLYNIPSRTGVNMLPETVAKLASRPAFVGIKESSGNLDQISTLIKMVPSSFDVISGDDSLTLPIMSLGGVGVISVLANIAPRQTAALVRYCLDGDYQSARKMHYNLLDIVRVLFIETNPVPVKEAAAMMGFCGSELRLPLVPLSDANRAALRAVLLQEGLLDATGR